ncbi:MAG: 30S ribosomal protein S6 [Clostridia bacterium]|nr:30S ribosomal protein S6 [Clostridia bacterium]MBP5194025.1 30S ribosomal protein S6 [Clostridia bacterium]
MKKYEMLYIIASEITDEAKEAVIAKFEKIVTESGGNVEKIDKWGTKKLAYPIDYKAEGYYVLMTFEADPTLNKELERVAGISDEVIRHMITKL